MNYFNKYCIIRIWSNERSNQKSKNLNGLSKMLISLKCRKQTENKNLRAAKSKKEKKTNAFVK